MIKEIGIFCLGVLFCTLTGYVGYKAMEGKNEGSK